MCVVISSVYIGCYPGSQAATPLLTMAVVRRAVIVMQHFTVSHGVMLNVLFKHISCLNWAVTAAVMAAVACYGSSALSA